MRRRILSVLLATAALLLGLAVVSPPAFAASPPAKTQKTQTSGGCSGSWCTVGGGVSTPGSTTSTTSAGPGMPGNPGGGGGGGGGATPPPNPCAVQYSGNYALNPCGGALPTGSCVLAATQVVLFAVPVGTMYTLGTWQTAVIVAGKAGQNVQKVTVTYCGPPSSSYWVPTPPSIPPQVTITNGMIATLARKVGIQTPTPWIMPSPAHPGPPPCSACTTYQESIEGYANHPEWLAIEQGPGVTSGLSAFEQQCPAGVCGSVGVTLTPLTVNFEWIGADSSPPFNAPVHTVSCPAGAIVTGAPAPLGYAPASYSLARAYDTWQHALWYQWWYKHAIYGGPGCDGSDWAGGNGTPRRTGQQSIDYLSGVGGGHPRVEFYTPRQVTKQDCIDVGNTPQNPWPAWCYQVPTVDTIHAYIVYKVSWTFGGVLAGATPPGLPHTYDVLTQDPGNVATTTLPVVAEHTHPTCFSGTGSRQQCNVNEAPGQGPMGPAPING